MSNENVLKLVHIKWNWIFDTETRKIKFIRQRLVFFFVSYISLSKEKNFYHYATAFNGTAMWVNYKCNSYSLNAAHVLLLLWLLRLLLGTVSGTSVEIHVICTQNERVTMNENGTRHQSTSIVMQCTNIPYRMKTKHTHKTKANWNWTHRNFPFKSIFELFIHCHTKRIRFSLPLNLRTMHQHSDFKMLFCPSNGLRCVQLTASKKSHRDVIK